VCTPPSRSSGLPADPIVIINGQSSNALSGFGWVPPTINSLSSYSIDAGGGQPLTVFGVGLYAIDTSVTLNGQTCSLQLSGAPLVDDVQLVVLPPAGTGVNLPLQVYVGGMLSNIAYLNYSRPNITAVSFLPSGAPRTDGTSTMVVNGISFGLTTGSVSVTSRSTGVVQACSAPVWGNNQITCSFPPGVGDVFVTVTASGQVSNSVNVSYALPTISSLSPSAGVNTAGGDQLQSKLPSRSRLHSCTLSSFTQNLMPVLWDLCAVNGDNFGTSRPPGGNVLIGLSTGLTPCQSIASWTTTSILCVTPAGNGSSLALTVTVATGVSVTVNTFRYLSPTISSVSAPSYPTAGGVPLVLSGSSFDSFGSVTVNGTACVVSSWSQTSITCTLPVGGGVSNLVAVRSVAGLTSPSSGTGSAFITYDRPVLGAVVPSPTDRGQSITIMYIPLSTALGHS
jgi:hypothetical protein